MRQITKVGKKYVKVSREDWDEMWRRLRMSIPQFNVGLAAGGGCGNFCGAACADNDGCDMSFGDPGECGALCGDGSVFLQEEEV